MTNSQVILNGILKLVRCKNEIEGNLLPINKHLAITYGECVKAALDETSRPTKDDLFKIDTILDYLHERLNTGHWSQVPLPLREAFTCCSYIKCILLLKLWVVVSPNADQHLNCLDVVKCLDLGILLGAPLLQNNDILTKSASLINSIVQNKEPAAGLKHLATSGKRKLSSDSTVPEKLNVYNKLAGKDVAKLSLPSLEEFFLNYMLPAKPVVIQDAITHWPACKKWMDINYLLRIAGSRTVPVELGSQYSDENWSQKLMTLQEFIEQYYLKDNNVVGYLAQHDLLRQIPELRNDICIPDYCCLSRAIEDSEITDNSEPEINAWFGPAGTVSSLHHDPKDNLLSQVYGMKQVLLFSPSDSAYLYPHDSNLLSNTAQVDPIKPDYDRFPNYKKANMLKCLLSAGDMLFIPPKWWHHVTALERSFSVNFWWQ